MRALQHALERALILRRTRSKRAKHDIITRAEGWQSAVGEVRVGPR